MGIFVSQISHSEPLFWAHEGHFMSLSLMAKSCVESWHYLSVSITINKTCLMWAGVAVEDCLTINWAGQGLLLDKAITQ